MQVCGPLGQEQGLGLERLELELVSQVRINVKVRFMVVQKAFFSSPKRFPYCCLEKAITALDAIKGAVDAGKRARNADEEENWKPSDFMRGLIQAAKESTRDGAAKRGKLHEKGNLIDWTVGATSNTAEYVLIFPR